MQRFQVVASAAPGVPAETGDPSGRLCEGRTLNCRAVEVVSLDARHSIRIMVFPMPTVRSRVDITCIRRARTGPVNVLSSEPGGFGMDNLSWSRSTARGDRLALSDRDLINHLLLELPGGHTTGTVCFSTSPRGQPYRPEPFKIEVDGPSILALRRWLLARDDAAIAGRLPNLRVVPDDQT